MAAGSGAVGVPVHVHNSDVDSDIELQPPPIIDTSPDKNLFSDGNSNIRQRVGGVFFLLEAGGAQRFTAIRAGCSGAMQHDLGIREHTQVPDHWQGPRDR